MYGIKDSRKHLLFLKVNIVILTFIKEIIYDK